MDIDRGDLTIFVYNWGVVLSGGYVALTYDITVTELLVFSLVIGFLWTIYYRSVMEEKLPPFDDRDEDGERIDEPDLSTENRKPDDDEPPEQGGPDAPWE
ncbi:MULTISPECIES: hypothetical protein [unclassified Halorhabdus]|uniref:hypothetical protein n=1 Tax=unclassified Halorhabdus TaxID=2621901 RepID=UPI0023DCCA8A|nr:MULTISPECIES: hypothetical protein [unclassified Halorhabdus]WEL16392.1 putative membrane protein [Halorhabdus sp. SVX81]WEL20278.1 putative membrane protein [Halorhabdus sp. BNX81]